MHATLDIKMGNAGMLTPNDVAEVLLHIVNGINVGRFGDPFEAVVTEERLPLRDALGNTVGEFAVGVPLPRRELAGLGDLHYAEAFIRSYRGTMLWANTYAEVDGEIMPLGDTDLDGDVDVFDFTTEADVATRRDCEDFLMAGGCEVLDTLMSLAETHGYGPESAGHDFALTRNHHGAGFWDRGLGDAGDHLTEVAHGFGDAHLYVTENGEVEHE